jgi:hypothetical protein
MYKMHVVACTVQKHILFYYSYILYIIILLYYYYMSVICFIWYKIFTVFQNHWGGGLRGIGGALPPVSTTALGVGDSSQPPGNYGAYYSLNVVGAIFAGV